MNQPDIACVVPTHGRPGMLAEALTSIFSQTLLPRVVCVVDDMSDPDTQQVAEFFSQRASVEVVYVPASPLDGGSGSAGRSRNIGAASTNSAYLAFLDDDDEWSPGFIEGLYTEASHARADVVVCWTEMTRGGWVGPGIRSQHGWDIGSALAKNPGLTGSNFLISREAFQRVGGFDADLRVANDWDLAIRLIDAGVTPAVLREPLVLQRAHSEGQLTSRTEARALGLEAFLARYGHRMRLRDRRELRRVIHSVRRVSAETHLRRTTHLLLQIANDSPMRLTEALAGRLAGRPTVYR